MRKIILASLVVMSLLAGCDTVKTETPIVTQSNNLLDQDANTNDIYVLCNKLEDLNVFKKYKILHDKKKIDKFYGSFLRKHTCFAFDQNYYNIHERALLAMRAYHYKIVEYLDTINPTYRVQMVPGNGLQYYAWQVDGNSAVYEYLSHHLRKIETKL